MRLKCSVCREDFVVGIGFCDACTQAYDQFNNKEPDTLTLLQWLAHRVWRAADTKNKATTSSRERKLLRALAQAQDLFGQVESAYANDRAPDRADLVHAAAQKGFKVCLAALRPYPPQEIA